MEKVFFPSDKETIAGNLFVPKKAQLGVLILHGGGKSNKERFVDLQKIFFDNDITSLAIDFRGVGESTGAFTQGSLKNRITDAKAALKELQKYTDRLVVFGSSMGGFVASLLAGEKNVVAIILSSAAAYSYESEDKPLNEEFTKEITKENSWENSRSFAFLRKWNGKLLVIYGEHDTVIPEGVKKRYQMIAQTKGKYIEIPGADHALFLPKDVEGEKAKIVVLQEIVAFLQKIYENFHL